MKELKCECTNKYLEGFEPTYTFNLRDMIQELIHKAILFIILITIVFASIKFVGVTVELLTK